MIDLKSVLKNIYEETSQINEGKVADYIPQLANVSPDKYAVAVCFADGAQAAWGDIDSQFCLQSVSKPINYALALDEHGDEKVHQHVGFEPSGQVFNALNLNAQGLPHNPLINAGGIMCAHLIQPGKAQSERFKTIQDQWEQLTGGASVGFDNAVYQSELESAHRNFALAYFMKEQGAFLPGTSIEKTLDLYFQSCSLSLTIDALAVVAATFANRGFNPLTQKQLIHHRSLRHCLTLMSTCGMYDYSGEFAFRIGLPAKSGVSGALMVVIPGVMGLALWSPLLDKYGNTVKGVAFCRKMIERLPFHPYDPQGFSVKSLASIQQMLN